MGVLILFELKNELRFFEEELRFFEDDLTAFKEFAYNAQALVRGFLQI